MLTNEFPNNCREKLFFKEEAYKNAVSARSVVKWSVVLTRQHGDADGATLTEHLNRGMPGHAGVPPLIRWAHLHQCQLRRRQDPIIPLNESKKKIRQHQCETNIKQKHKSQLCWLQPRIVNIFSNSKHTSWVVRSEKPAALHGSRAKVSPLT